MMKNDEEEEEEESCVGSTTHRIATKQSRPGNRRRTDACSELGNIDTCT